MPVWFTLPVVLVAGLVLVWVLAVVAYGRGLFSPSRMTDGRAMARLGRMTPGDLGWKYETLDFEGKNGVKIAGWYVPLAVGRGEKLAILVHGYADAKVGALAWGPVFRGLGYDLLLVDLRGHGESGGTHTTAGVWEAEDLAGVFRAVTSSVSPPREIVLFGASLGAASVARLASADEFAGEMSWPGGRVTAVVLDSPVASFELGAIGYAGLLAMPGAFVVRPAVRLMAWWWGFDVRKTAAWVTIPGLRVPGLVVVPGGDALVSERDRGILRRAFEAHVQSHRSARWYAPQTPHLMGLSMDPEGYLAEVRALLGEAGVAVADAAEGEV